MFRVLLVSIEALYAFSFFSCLAFIIVGLLLFMLCVFAERTNVTQYENTSSLKTLGLRLLQVNKFIAKTVAIVGGWYHRTTSTFSISVLFESLTIKTSSYVANKNMLIPFSNCLSHL